MMSAPTGVAFPLSNVGGRFVGGGVDVPVANFEFDIDGDIRPAPSMPAGRLMEYTTGKVTGSVAFGGIWARTFNPFQRGLKVQAHIQGTFYLDYPTGQVVAQVPDLLVAHWKVRASCELGGQLVYECVLVCNFDFNDFGGTPV